MHDKEKDCKCRVVPPPPQGPQGPPGKQGPQGPMGIPGIPGSALGFCEIFNISQQITTPMSGDLVMLPDLGPCEGFATTMPTNNEIMIPATGFYQITYSIDVSLGQGDMLVFRVLINGSGLSKSQSVSQSDGMGTNSSRTTVSRTMLQALTMGDTIEVEVLNATLTGQNGYLFPVLDIIRYT
ncbi:BclA C-terminal domain-containing protein [Cytobacillus sp. IB215316]|uniref:BclA C-terminal domain-containing protein n=1 Tax=Cytobacillus sp. IB215316 TaxID=3097354 RepID=UPI002A0AE230|nr:hypothetical protein [Cytobacillus sp. IB215316]MDX8363198.1 hypothetical protein [Cytobacillus sp. IB215316]